jgi:hypothetical protein
MELLQIRTQKLEDAKKPLFHEAVGAKVTYGNLTVIGILENGTENGKASVAFLIQTGENEYVIAETTAALMHTFDAALQGAEANFALKQKG